MTRPARTHARDRVSLLTVEDEPTGAAWLSDTCAHCGWPRSAPSDLTAAKRIAARPAGDDLPVPRRMPQQSPAATSRLHAGAPAAMPLAAVSTKPPVLHCIECKLDLQPCSHPDEAAYFVRVHNEMHHGAWPRRHS